MITTTELRQGGPAFSRIVVGLWRLVEWGYSAEELLRFLHDCMDLGATTFDHADIYGDYKCERLFGEALRLEPGLRN